MIVEALVRLLVAEHKSDPIQGRLLVLGKQTIATPLSKILSIFDEQGCGINPHFDPLNIKMDKETRLRGEDSIDDADFFRLFGDVVYDSMDVTSYEGATIIHDLNYPIPPELEGKFDFIVDGGTFDHLCDIKTAFANVVKMLKPGGRIFQWNAASNYANAGYLSFSADFFYDYYSLNKFEECRTYFAESWDISAPNWFIYEFLPQNEAERYPKFRRNILYNMVLVFARKGAHSTFDRLPVQLQYRDPQLLEEYRQNTAPFRSTRARTFSVKPLRASAVKVPLRDWLVQIFVPRPKIKAYQPIGWV